MKKINLKIKNNKNFLLSFFRLVIINKDSGSIFAKQNLDYLLLIILNVYI
jgi:hypothetical protein